MRDLLNDILNMEGVKGVMILSTDGGVIFNEMRSGMTDPNGKEWAFFIDSMKDISEAELVFTGARVYVRKSGTSYVLILADLTVPMPMLRLNCDIMLPALKAAKGSKGIKGFFKR